MNENVLEIKTLLDTTGVDKGVDSLSGSVSRGAAMIGAALVTTAVGLGTLAIKSFAQYEQLAGGVETLFKKNSKEVMAYADNAYKTAGMSANKYMETVTSFSASLLQSLDGDTKKSAEYANRAVTDMSDNANKMGTSIESIQFAYQGFAKQNYTMLDNLKLGYGGTKEEMERLIKDASKMKDVQKKLGITVDENSISFGNIVNAISVVQDHMGIAGTTAKEANSTIEGSANQMKAAWENLLTAFAGGGDVDKAMKNLADSVAIFLGNLIPRIKIVAQSLGKAFAKSLVPAVIKGLRKLGDAVPLLRPITSILSAIIRNFDRFKIIIVMLVSAFVAYKAVTTAVTAAQILLNAAMSVNPVMLIIMAIAALVGGFIYLWKTSEGFRAFWINLWTGIKNFVTSVVMGIVTFFTETLPNGIRAFISKAIDFLIWWETLPIRIAIYLAQVIAKVVAWVADLVGRAVSGIADFVRSIVNGIKSLPGKFVSIGGQIISGFWNGINDKFGWLMNMIGGFFGKVKSKIKSFFGIKSPSRWGEKDIGNNLIYGIANGITRKTAYALGVVSDFTNSVKDRFASDMQGVEADLTVNGGYNGARLKRDAITLPPGARYNQVGRNGVSAGETTVMQTININQPVETPGEHARVLRSEAVKFGLAGNI
jgi:phage-related protein